MKLFFPGFLTDFNRDHGYHGIEFSFCQEGRKGSYTIDFEILPLSKKDFNTLFRDKITHEAAEKMACFFREYIAFCERAINFLKSNNTERDNKQASQIETDIKRFLAMFECLTDMHQDIQPEAVKHEIIKPKKAIIYASHNTHGGIKAVEFPGVMFEKEGILFTAYKDKIKKRVYVLEAFSGISITSYSGGVNSAANYINDREIRIINNFIKADSYKKVVDDFREMIEKEDFSIPEYMNVQILTVKPFKNVKKDTNPAAPASVLADDIADKKTDNNSVNQASEKAADPNKAKTTYKPPYMFYVFRYSTIKPKNAPKKRFTSKGILAIVYRFTSRYKPIYTAKTTAKTTAGKHQKRLALLTIWIRQKPLFKGKSPPPTKKSCMKSWSGFLTGIG